MTIIQKVDLKTAAYGLINIYFPWPVFSEADTKELTK